MDLSLSTRTEGDRTVVEVGGEIDVYTAPRLREQLVDLVADGKYHLVVDMERVDFLDSTGLGVLVGGLKRVRAHDGSLRLVCTQERILKIFRITGLTKVFPIHASVDEAVARHRVSASRQRRPSTAGKVPVATVELRFSALPAHVRTARLVAAAVARRSGVDEGVLDEVRLAVGEACSRAVHLHRRHCPDRPVLVTLVDDADAFRVAVTDEAPAEPGGGEGFGALADVADLVDAEAVPAGRRPGRDRRPGRRRRGRDRPRHRRRRPDDLAHHGLGRCTADLAAPGLARRLRLRRLRPRWVHPRP